MGVKIARIRVLEKDWNIPGEYIIHSIEFIDEQGSLIGQINSRNYPRSGNTRDIFVGKNERIVGIYQ